eukprot:CAMPEP_0178373754 /NCGR_PEP_ID=MMETSP0689_2-20121128/2025_1 /TAXON_ID=160604 /ORGANISM="Amphidinium massartii, Strain CS-259" /LENGTH=887 /DNA_ID=CAMNT_0019993705 /DNA_START=27 /DNA_END=2690 /DNA_ORIENTATION=+
MKFGDILKSLIVAELREGYIRYEELASQAEELCDCAAELRMDCIHSREFNDKVQDELYRVNVESEQLLEKLKHSVKFFTELLRICDQRRQQREQEKESQLLKRQGTPRGSLAGSLDSLLSRNGSDAEQASKWSTPSKEGKPLHRLSLSKSGTPPREYDADKENGENQNQLLGLINKELKEFHTPFQESAKKELRQAYQQSWQVQQMAELNLEGFRKLLKKREKTLRKGKKKSKHGGVESLALTETFRSNSDRVKKCWDYFGCPCGGAKRRKASEDLGSLSAPILGWQRSPSTALENIEVTFANESGNETGGDVSDAAKNGRLDMAKRSKDDMVKSLKDEAFFRVVHDGAKSIGKEIEEKFAEHLTKGNQEQAQKQLRAHTREAADYRTILDIGLYIGASVGLWSLNFGMWNYPRVEDCPNCTEVLLGFIPVFRLTFMPILWLGCWSWLCKIWRDFDVNYPWILDINPRSELGPSRGCRMAAQLLLGWSVFFTIFLYINRTGVDPILAIGCNCYPLALFSAFCLLAMLPSGAFRYKTRFWLYESFAKTALAPLYEVRLRENFVADVMTSMVKEFADLRYTFTLFYTGDFLHHRLNKLPEAAGDWGPPCIMAVPFWCRMWQCIRRYHDSAKEGLDKKDKKKDKKGAKSDKWRELEVLRSMLALRGDTKHLWNAGKYLISLLSIFLSFLGGFQHIYGPHVVWSYFRQLWIGSLFLGTLWAFIWDIVQDMGIIHVTWSKWLSVPHIEVRTTSVFYSPWTFGAITFLNLLGRCAWAYTIVPHQAPMNHTEWEQISNTFFAVVEVLRRAMWTLMRIEHEYSTNPNNYQSYSNVPTAVPMNQDNQDDHAEDEPVQKLTAAKILMWAVWLLALGLLSMLAIFHDYFHFTLPGHKD